MSPACPDRAAANAAAMRRRSRITKACALRAEEGANGIATADGGDDTWPCCIVSFRTIWACKHQNGHRRKLVCIYVHRHIRSLIYHASLTRGMMQSGTAVVARPRGIRAMCGIMEGGRLLLGALKLHVGTKRAHTGVSAGTNRVLLVPRTQPHQRSLAHFD